MKKNYVKPNTLTVNIVAQPVLGVVSNGSGEVTSVGVSSNSYDSDEGGILSRGGYWDDED